MKKEDFKEFAAPLVALHDTDPAGLLLKLGVLIPQEGDFQVLVEFAIDASLSKGERMIAIAILMTHFQDRIDITVTGEVDPGVAAIRDDILKQVYKRQS